VNRVSLGAVHVCSSCMSKKFRNLWRKRF
jgi:hypothetical protein